MPRFKNSRGVALMMIATAAFVVLPACGGGSSTPDYKVSANPLVIKTAVLPALLSGEDVDVEIELTGGCGGPYVVQVISPGVNGGMPPGVGLENREVPTEGPDGILGTLDDGVRNAAVMTGVLLRDGVYGFTIQCTDPTCTPAFHDQRSYNWSIGRGDVRIVGADPALIPEATLDVVPKHIAWDPLLPPPADPNLIPNTAAWALDYQPVDGVKTTVFGQFTAIDFIVAGGIPPYVLFNRDDGADPSDALGGADGLPLGIVIADASTSLVGTPSQILSGGVPFVLTLEAQDDSVIPLVSEWRKVQWKIDTPPIIVATPSIDSAFAGGSQTALIQGADGVPPFRFELLSIPGPEDLADHDYPGTPTYPACGPNDGLPHFCGVAAPGILLGINPADLGMANRRLYAGAVNRNVKFVGNDNSAVAGGEEYPLIDAIGPFSVFPSEGTYLIDQGPSSGTLAGIPARVGTFTIHVHVYSELVPKAYGQHAFKSYTYDVDDSDDNPGRPAFAMTPAFTSQNLFLPASQGYSDIPEGEVSVIYTPANSPAAPNGLQCTAEGGVANDGKTNGPHKSQVIDDGTTAGTYQWQAAFNDPIGGLAYDQANADAYFDFMTENNGISEGRFGIVAKLPAGPPSTDGDPNALTRRSRELIDVEVEDHQLPKRVDPLSHRKTEMRQLGLSVGPDKVIITDTSSSGIGFPSSTATITQAAGQWDLHHAEHRVKKLEFKGGSGVISPLTSADLTAGTDIPDIGQDGIGATDLGQLLSGQSPGDPNVELLRPIVNATGWWDDMSHTGFYGARSGQHADFNAAYTYLTGDYRSNGGYQPNIASIDLPAYGIKPGFTPAPPAGTKADGIFLDGGQMYAFTGTNRMGFFIIRRDASVYVPFAIKRTDYQTFGDNMQAVKENRSNSMFRTLQMTVSPDNRYAVCEISKQSAGSQHHLNTIDQSMLVVFSLLGEKRPEWGNKTYALIDPTGMGLTLQPGGEGLYLMASSLALTNNHVYFLVGNHSTDSYRRS